MNFGFGNTLEMKVRSKKDTITGFKKIKLLEALNVSSAYNFFADSLNLSDIRISGRTTLIEKLSVNFNMNLSPYAQDTNLRAINKWLVSETGQLTRLTTATVALNLSLNGKSRQNDYQSNAGTEAELAQINAERNQYIDFNIPWNANISYNFTVNNQTKDKTRRFVQTLQFSGDVNLTSKWKVGITSGYDFVNKVKQYGQK